MVNSVGRKLQQARLARQLSVEEAARVTRIRPDKLIDLEEDNYSNFPSMSYAKGFLLLYARFLDVDVRDFAETLHTPNPVSSDDYEYLNAAATGPQPAPAHRAYHPAPRRQHTILPVIVFAVLAGAVGLAIYLFVSFQRIGNLDEVGDKKEISSPAPAAAAPTEAPAVSAPAPAITAATPLPFSPTSEPALRPPPPALAAATPMPAPAPTGAPAATPEPAPAIVAASPLPEASPAPAEAMPSPAPAAAFDPTREVRRAEPVFPTPPAHAKASPAESPPAVGDGPAISAVVPMDTPAPTPDSVREVTILPLRKTWITIRKDAADSLPIFEDYLYPGDSPLKLSGRKFWITVKDPTAVRITRDGQALPGGRGDIEIE